MKVFAWLTLSRQKEVGKGGGGWWIQPAETLNLKNFFFDIFRNLVWSVRGH